jgi:hypothetical protein
MDTRKVHKPTLATASEKVTRYAVTVDHRPYEESERIFFWRALLPSLLETDWSVCKLDTDRLVCQAD